MTERDILLTHLYEASQVLKTASALAQSADLQLQTVEAIAQSFALVDAAIDAVTHQAFDEGTASPLSIKRPLQLRQKTNQETHRE
jgi:hypothetical protein